MRRLTPLVAGLLVACGAGESGPGAALAEQIESAATLEAIEFVAPDADWAILLEQARRAYDAGLDTVPLGEAVAGVGRSFLGTPYVAHTLEVPGDLVVACREPGGARVGYTVSALFFGALIAACVACAYIVTGSVFTNLALRGFLPTGLGSWLAPILFASVGITWLRSLKA